ncbi:hypothetical protein ACFOMD_06055 [Sphingoaurantiacus capsulatus]|uniref:Uncharacterized protein n=1 Tax=Sphingoaurantiacus capsulatus TaxID=1771310 RepID=A0ABV7X7W8_9SPHN
MKFMVGAALIALAGLSAPAMAQSGETKPKKVRMACKEEAVTGSFTRKAKQCRTAVNVTERKEAPKAQAATTPVPASQPAPATTPPQADTTAPDQPGTR